MKGERGGKEKRERNGEGDDARETEWVKNVNKRREKKREKRKERKTAREKGKCVRQGHGEEERVFVIEKRSEMVGC